MNSILDTISDLRAALDAHDCRQQPCPVCADLDHVRVYLCTMEPLLSSLLVWTGDRLRERYEHAHRPLPRCARKALNGRARPRERSRT